MVECWNLSSKQQPQSLKSGLTTLKEWIETLYTKFIRWVVYILLFALTIGDAYIQPPAKYPYLFPLLFALLGFGVFLIVFIYSNIKMIDSYNKDCLRKEEYRNE